MELATVILVVVLAVTGAVLGASVLPAWADVETRGAGRSGVRTRLLAGASAAAAFGLLAARVGFDYLLPAFIALAAAGVAISIVDLREKRIPNRMLLISAPVIAALLGGGLLARGEPTALLGVVVGAAAMFVLYFAIALIVPAAMGMGDVKLASILGGALGGLGLAAWLVGLMAAFLIGGLVAAISLIVGVVGRRGSIPFGPWMIVGALAGAAL